jgi:RNA ligase (TIGR02306 family)
LRVNLQYDGWNYLPVFVIPETEMLYILDGQGNRLDVKEGDDVANFLSIRKYQPEIPADMLGKMYEVEGLPSFDVEPFEKYTGVFEPGEPVVATEKLHGVFTGISYIPGYAFPIVYSKGFGSKNPLAFTMGPENDRNIYVRAVRKLLAGPTGTALNAITESAPDQAFHIFGETFGPGVQDLHYGLTELEFRAFDIYEGTWRKGAFLSPSDFAIACGFGSLKTAPILYAGPFDLDALTKVVGGKDSLSGKHVREGIVVRPENEREVFPLGRLLVKMVNPEYKLRKGGGEELA